MGTSHLHNLRGGILPRKGRRKLRGYETFVDHTGLIHVVPKAQRRRVPVMPIVLLAAMLVLFKALAMANVGLNDYQSKVASLQSGDTLERAAGFVLQADPASNWVYSVLKGALL